MAEIVTLKVETRSNTGTGSARELRRNGLLPIVVYGSGKENLHATVDQRVISKAIANGGFYTRLFEINKERVLPRQVDFHPVTDQPIHVDFLRVSKDARVNVYIPLHFINEDASPGLKRGGVLNTVIHDLEVSCISMSIPEFIEVDLAGLDMSHSIHLKDVKLPSGVELLAKSWDPEMTIATIMASSSARSEEASAQAGEGAEVPGEETAETEGGEAGAEAKAEE